jgi:7-cyano-7-deazaguanine synthase
MDSATTLALALEDGFEAHALTVRYGQRHGIEVERAQELAVALGARSHRVVDVDLRAFGGSALTDDRVPVPAARARDERHGIPATYVPARNTLLLALALAWAETLGARELHLGANAVDYSGYPDCRPEFLEAFERVANLGTRAGRFHVRAPLMCLSKADIVREAVRLGVDLGRTVSCYDPGPTGAGCGMCEACALRAEGFREAGLPDPAG